MSWDALEDIDTVMCHTRTGFLGFEGELLSPLRKGWTGTDTESYRQ